MATSIWTSGGEGKEILTKAAVKRRQEAKKIRKEVMAVVSFFKKYPPANRGTVMNIANRIDELMHDGKLTGEEAFALQQEVHSLWPDS